MPSDRRERSGSAGSAKSAASRASSSMGRDGGEAGRRMAAEDELIRRELQDQTTFCNSFWGSQDAGYPVMQARMKNSARIVDDVRAMYKERAEIEAEYAKRLAKLAKQQFGRDETGSMKHALEIVRGEIEQTAKTHADLSNVFKKDLEGQLAEFQNRTQSQRKGPLTNIEKLYKQKTTQESYVNKSRDKYEQDCIRINGYTAQSSLVQGRDLEKVTTKLDKAQSTVNGNDKDYQNFVRALKDTTLRWNSEWKSYLDQCQDLEEERLEFLKSNLWNYANAISAVCVADDQSCERVRVSLEACEAPRDIMDFIHRAGTGAAIPDAPDYINYGRGQPPPARPTYKTASFQRSSTRPSTFIAPTAPPINPATANAPPSSESRRDSLGRGGAPPGDVSGLASEFSRQTISGDQENETVNNSRAPPGGVALAGMVNSQSTLAGDGFGGGESLLPNDRSDRRMSAKKFLERTPSRSQTGMSRSGTNGPAGMQSAQSTYSNAQQSDALSNSDTTGTMGTTIIKPAPPPASVDTLSGNAEPDDDDPIARALADLRNKPSRSPAPQQGRGPTPSGRPGATHSFNSVGKQTRGEMVTSPGAYSNPSNHGDNRARSPSAAFMQEPERAVSPQPDEEIVGRYGQSFPGERRTVSRQNSNASRHSRLSMQAPPSGQQQASERARSPGPMGDTSGFAGVGARGRSPSPQPFQQPGRSPQRQPVQPSANPQGQYQQRQSGSTPQSRPGQTKPNSFNTPQRSTTPLGISLDASGSVTHDQMADDFIKRTGSVGPQQGRTMTPQQLPPQQASGLPHHMQHQASFNSGHPSQQSPFGAQHGSQYSAVSSQQSTPIRQGPPFGGQSGYAQTPTHGTPGPMAPAGYQQTPPPQQARQDTMNSLGRQTGAPFAAAGGASAGYQSPSPYNQRPASATAPPVNAQVGTPGHSFAQSQPQQQQQPMYGQQPTVPQETAASAYMHQYQQQSYQQQPQPMQAQQHPAMAGGQQQAPYGQWNAPSNAQPAPTNGAYANTQVHQPIAQTPTAPAANANQPPPTGQYSNEGKPILFYVKALYDYEAQLQEEFSFTGGDVIAVWETNADGWWQGELLDDARRRLGSNTFPSNFVSLLN